MNMKLGGLQSRSGRFGDMKKMFTQAEIRTSDPSARSVFGLPTTLLRFRTARNKTDGMSDIHNIYCCGVPTLSPRASIQRLSSLCNAPQESSCSCRIRTSDTSVRRSKTYACSTTWRPRLVSHRFSEANWSSLSRSSWTPVYVSVARFRRPDEVSGDNDYKTAHACFVSPAVHTYQRYMCAVQCVF